MAVASANELIGFNPATGVELGRVETTPVDEVAAVVERAHAAQRIWSGVAWPERRQRLKRWAQRLARDADAWAEAICREIGKPLGEAYGEVATSLDAVRWTIRYGGRALADETLRAGWQSMLLIPKARVRYQPLGVIGMIGTWNYPLFLNAPAIAQALAGGNGVVWKPSELAPLVGRLLQESLHEADLPAGLVGMVQGRGDVGHALVDARIDKGMFTGGLANGRRVLTTLASNGVPALAELSGFDAAIVLPDAPLAATVRSLVWGAFVGCGQTCVAVKRIYVVGDATPWIRAIADAARSLRVGDPASDAVDLGPLISSEARERFDRTIRAAVALGAEVVAGGAPCSGPGWYYSPTVLAARSPEPEAALAGVFGPVVLIRPVNDVEEATAAANASEFGLAASVWGRDLDAARAVARRLEAGTVTVNDAVAPIGHAAAPFGGAKSSGYGRIHGVHGLREFVQPQVELTRRAGGLRPQVFPYEPRVRSLLKAYIRLFHRPS